MMILLVEPSNYMICVESYLVSLVSDEFVKQVTLQSK